MVASESPTYSGTLGVFDARSVTYVEVRGDEDGVRVDDVERVFSEYRPRLFYVNPIAQNPTGAVLPARRAKQIVALAHMEYHGWEHAGMCASKTDTASCWYNVDTFFMSKDGGYT